MIHKFRMELYIEPQESKQIKPLKKIISFIGIFPHIDQTMTTQQKPVRSRKVQSNSVECPISKNLAGHILHSHGTWSIQQFFFFFLIQWLSICLMRRPNFQGPVYWALMMSVSAGHWILLFHLPSSPPCLNTHRHILANSSQFQEWLADSIFTYICNCL